MALLKAFFRVRGGGEGTKSADSQGSIILYNILFIHSCSVIHPIIFWILYINLYPVYLYIYLYIHPILFSILIIHLCSVYYSFIYVQYLIHLLIFSIWCIHFYFILFIQLYSVYYAFFRYLVSYSFTFIHIIKYFIHLIIFMLYSSSNSPNHIHYCIHPIKPIN